MNDWFISSDEPFKPITYSYCSEHGLLYTGAECPDCSAEGVTLADIRDLLLEIKDILNDKDTAGTS